jgi:hypothetical protein
LVVANDDPDLSGDSGKSKGQGEDQGHEEKVANQVQKEAKDEQMGTSFADNPFDFLVALDWLWVGKRCRHN